MNCLLILLLALCSNAGLTCMQDVKMRGEFLEIGRQKVKGMYEALRKEIAAHYALSEAEQLAQKSGFLETAFGYVEQIEHAERDYGIHSKNRHSQLLTKLKTELIAGTLTAQLFEEVVKTSIVSSVPEVQAESKRAAESQGDTKRSAAELQAEQDQTTEATLAAAAKKQKPDAVEHDRGSKGDNKSDEISGWKILGEAGSTICSAAGARWLLYSSGKLVLKGSNPYFAAGLTAREVYRGAKFLYWLKYGKKS